MDNQSIPNEKPDVKVRCKFCGIKFSSVDTYEHTKSCVMKYVEWLIDRKYEMEKLKIENKEIKEEDQVKIPFPFGGFVYIIKEREFIEWKKQNVK